MLVCVVNHLTHDFLVFPVSYLTYFDEVVQKFKKRQWHLSVLTEVSSLTFLVEFIRIGRVFSHFGAMWVCAPAIGEF